MNNLKKVIAAGVAVSGLSAFMPISASAEWKSDDNGYMYSINNENVKGWKYLDHTLYFYGDGDDENSTNEKTWYYFDSNGYMKTGWIKDGYKWYYMKSDGSMAKNCVIDGYAIGNDGAWIVDGGWKRDNTGWWYSYGSGCGYAIGWKSFENPYDDPHDTSSLNHGDIWYYFDSNGYMYTGWIQSSGKWYYLNSDGSMAVNATVNGYIIDENGVWVDRLGQVNYDEGIVTLPEKSVYPLGTTKVKYDVINNTGKVYETFYGPSELEKYENNKWVPLTNMRYEELLEELKNDDNYCIARIPLDISKIYSTEINLTDFKEFDSSKPGKYRIPFDGGSQYTTMYKEFEIK
ncbi:MAG: hypothetical protein Q4F66_01220 [Clostridium sp.]|nr:hypothetical protein [Clostridium sp.]